jgi:hypothetical protein
MTRPAQVAGAEPASSPPIEAGSFSLGRRTPPRRFAASSWNGEGCRPAVRQYAERKAAADQSSHGSSGAAQGVATASRPRTRYGRILLPNADVTPSPRARFPIISAPAGQPSPMQIIHTGRFEMCHLSDSRINLHSPRAHEKLQRPSLREGGQSRISIYKSGARLTYVNSRPIHRAHNR